METMRSRRLKIIEPALKGYNGFIGAHEFVDGVTPYPVSWIEADQIGASIQVEDADEEGHVISPVMRMHHGRTLAADDPSVQSVGMGVEVDGEIRQIAQFYTHDELGQIADRRGLQGLRDIGNCWGVSARSVTDMIERIMKAQMAHQVGSSPAIPTSADVVETTVDIEKAE